MKKNMLALAIFAAAMAAPLAHADTVYGGLGFPGSTIGYSHPITDAIAVRGEYSGGLSIDKNGSRSGVDFNGNFKASTLGAFVDWSPMNNGLRLTGGLTFNDTKFSLAARGGSATINGKSVNMTGETFNLDLTYPGVTPYVGVGYASKPSGGKGWGYYTDAGVSIGKFKTSASTSIVGKQGVTQADVDQQVRQVSDSVSKLSVMPKISFGVTYSF